ncbi:hypothetical protein L7F22_000284 [Adiantum nelumboides]|nr:hypothetical protein [Adiantum nelumboides]
MAKKGKKTKKRQKFREGSKNVSFVTYDGTYGTIDKVLAFIQQFDAAFGGENFTESSKLRSMAMHLQKSTRQWWASLKVQGKAPTSWAECREAILKQFLQAEAKDEVLTTWRSLKMNKNEPIQKYVERFWDANLKAMVYKRIDFAEQRQQYCAKLIDEIREYVQAQRPKTIAALIHHTRVAAKIGWKNQGQPSKEGKPNASNPNAVSTRKRKARLISNASFEKSTIETTQSMENLEDKLDVEQMVEDTNLPASKDLVLVQEDPKDKDDAIDELIPLAISKADGFDFLSRLALNLGMLAPRIPLCRCRINERVRELRHDLSRLKSMLEKEGYMAMKGSLILLTNLPDGSTLDVDDTITSTWDRHWQAINAEFEEELQSKEEWSMLAGKMFFVWEGNHRAAAWMGCINETFANIKGKHIRVQAEFIIPNEKDEQVLVATLQRINLMHEEAIVTTNLKDYLFHTSTLCALDETPLMESFTEAEKNHIASGKWDTAFEVACKKINPGISKEDKDLEVTKARKNVIKTYNRKMLRILSVVNPSNGKEWFAVLWKLTFEDPQYRINLEKLYALSSAACSPNLNCSMLKLLGQDDNVKQSYGMPLGDHQYISWLSKERKQPNRWGFDDNRMGEEEMSSVVGYEEGEMLRGGQRDILATFKGECMSDSGSSCSINEEEKKRIDEELRALKEKDLQERNEATNKGGRPPNKCLIDSQGELTILM